MEAAENMLFIYKESINFLQEKDDQNIVEALRLCGALFTKVLVILKDTYGK